MIGIVGLGVIGGSYAMALKAAGLGPVAGMDVDRAALDQALAMGIIQQGGRPDKALLGIWSSSPCIPPWCPDFWRSTGTTSGRTA